MPFCTNCGSQVGDRDAYCQTCGSPQGTAGRTAPNADPFSGISNRTVAVLCYIPVFGVIPAVIVLASQRYRHNPRVRFDGFQALYLFVAWLIVSSAAPTILFTGVPGAGLQHAVLALCKLGLMICWIYLLVKAAQEQQVRLPIIGDLAARSTTEQL